MLEELEDKLDSFDSAERKEALLALCAKAEGGEVTLPAPGTDVARIKSMLPSSGTMEPTIGGALALWPVSGLITIPTLLGVGMATGRASLGSITITLVLPLVFAVRAILGHGPWAYVAHGLATSAVTLWALRRSPLNI